MDHNRAIEIIDGLLLGDGSLIRAEHGAYFYMRLSKPLTPHKEDTEQVREKSLQEYMMYMKWITDNAFTPLGVELQNGHPKIGSRVSKGKFSRYAVLATRQSPILTNLYDEWYVGGDRISSPEQRINGAMETLQYVHGATKIIPARLMQAITLSACTLTQFHIGDGSCAWYSHDGKWPSTMVRFATSNFTEKEVYHLMEVFNNMGMPTRKPSRDKRVEGGSGLVINLACRGDGNDHFMDLVGPVILNISGSTSSLMYKHLIKRKHDLEPVFNNLRERLIR